MVVCQFRYYVNDIPISDFSLGREEITPHEMLQGGGRPLDGSNGIVGETNPWWAQCTQTGLIIKPIIIMSRQFHAFNKKINSFLLPLKLMNGPLSPNTMYSLHTLCSEHVAFVFPIAHLFPYRHI